MKGTLYGGVNSALQSVKTAATQFAKGSPGHSLKRDFLSSPTWYDFIKNRFSK
jgi:hypothetical protein